ncbi:MAG: hypothetical protein ACXQTR_01765 [Candidatus Methanospirareceae archaeon]
MIITNKYDLPQALVDAVTHCTHKGEDYSASQLTKSARQFWLAKRHEVTKDASEMIWALFGTAVHAILEKADDETRLTEEYLTTEVLGHKLSGVCDLYENHIVNDWKTTSVWSYILMDEQKRHDYECQVNTYACLFRQSGFRVDGVKIIMLFRDWQASKAKYDSNYPQSQVKVLPLTLWTMEEQRAFLGERISYFERYRDTPDYSLPPCTPTERWVKPGKWALMKEGRNSAIKLYTSEEEAQENCTQPKQYVQERPSEQWKRCEYCDGKEFCSQYKEGNK